MGIIAPPVNVSALAARLQPVTQRAPSGADDTGKGYSAADRWQVGGHVYAPSSVRQGAAIWAPIYPRPVALPADLLPSVVGAWGTTALKAGFTGPAIDVTYTKASAPVVATINILAGGALDRATLYAVLASRDAGTLARVTKVYDQSGTNHLTASTVGGPLIGMRSANGYEQISWGNNLGEAGLEIPSTVSVGRQNFSVFMFGSAVGSTGRASSTAPLIAMELGNTFSGFGVSLQSSTSITNLGPGSLIAYTAAPTTNNGFTLGMPVGPQVLGFHGSATALTMTVNEQTSSVAAGGSQSMQGGIIGRTARVAGAEGMFFPFGIVINAATATAAQAAAVRQSAYANFGITPQVRDQILVVGDSRSQGIRTDHGYNWPTLLHQRLSTRYAVDVVNNSMFGLQLVSINDPAGAVAGAVAQYRPGARNIAVVLAGTNDAGAGTTAATAAGYLQSIVNKLRTAGYKVVVVNELYRASTVSNSAMDVYRSAFAQTSGATVIDPLTEPMLADPTNAAVFTDGLHPSTAGSAALAGFVEPYVTALLS